MIIIDLECTGRDNVTTRGDIIKPVPMEIVEIGAADVEVSSSINIRSTFQSFIKPILNPMLSQFCKDLTSIKQEQVSKASTFPVVLDKFKEWLSLCQDVIFVSWGRFDRKQLIEDCILHKQVFPFDNAYLNLRALMQQFLSLPKQPSISEALKIVNLEFKGTQNRAIMDVTNIVCLLQKLSERDSSFTGRLNNYLIEIKQCYRSLS